MRYIIARPYISGKVGIGHQFLNWLAGATLARIYDLKQIHCPFDGEHVEKGVVHSVKMWEDFLGFGKNLLTEKDIPKNLQVIRIPKFESYDSPFHPMFKQYIIDNHLSDIIFECPYNSFISIDWGYYFNNDLKEQYNCARQKNPVLSYFDSNFINVAVHIRRGAINRKDYPSRWISTTEYYDIIKNIQNKHPNTFFHIYSLGEIDDFKELHDFKNIQFHLNENDLISFDHMVRSDIFINSKSAFSVLVNYLHRGYKIYFPWDNYRFGDLYNNINYQNLKQFIENLKRS